MLVPKRHTNNSDYRYGFQGQEKDDEIKGKGNSLNFTFRMHDPRVGRFFTTDPLEQEYPYNSPYAFSENDVISHVELEGGEKRWVVKDNSVVYDPGPKTGGYYSEEAARRALQASRQKHKLPAGYPTFSQDKRTAAERTAHKKKIEAQRIETEFYKHVYNDPSMLLAHGVYVGGGEAALDVSGAKIIDAIGDASKIYRVFKNSTLAQRTINSFKSVSVITPYDGAVVQQYTRAALSALKEVKAGATLYRIGTKGKSKQGAAAQFWSLENPLLDPQAYAKKYNVPIENIKNADFIETATLKDGAQVITREAGHAPGSTNTGKGIEAVIEEGGTTNNIVTEIKRS